MAEQLPPHIRRSPSIGHQRLVQRIATAVQKRYGEPEWTVLTGMSIEGAHVIGERPRFAEPAVLVATGAGVLNEDADCLQPNEVELAVEILTGHADDLLHTIAVYADANVPLMLVSPKRGRVAVIVDDILTGYTGEQQPVMRHGAKLPATVTELLGNNQNQ